MPVSSSYGKEGSELWIILTVGVLLTGCGVYEFAIRGADYGLPFLLFGALVFFLYGCVRWERRRAGELHKWVADREEAVRQGSAMLDGKPLTPESPMARYGLCLSFLFVTVRLQSGWYLTDRRHARRRITAALFTITTLLLGWWCFPFGLTRTLGVLRQNLTGGERMTVEGWVWTPGWTEEQPAAPQPAMRWPEE